MVQRSDFRGGKEIRQNLSGAITKTHSSCFRAGARVCSPDRDVPDMQLEFRAHEQLRLSSFDRKLRDVLRDSQLEFGSWKATACSPRSSRQPAGVQQRLRVVARLIKAATTKHSFTSTSSTGEKVSHNVKSTIKGSS